ncbi:MFS transporter, partial [Streptomyces sp. NEAU-H3]|nr:MFS transporter [Streptomyces sp. NEAU-H3]
CCFAGTGVVFGSLEVTTVSGTGGAAGVLLGVQAAGSGLAGLALGAYGRPLRLGRCLALMAALLLLPPLCAATTDAAWPLAPALLLIGTATAPVMITAMNTLHVRVPARRLTEAMSWAVTAILAGSSAGATAAGHLADGPHPWLGYAIPPMAAAGAWLAVRAGSRERQAPHRTVGGPPARQARTPANGAHHEREVTPRTAPTGPTS